MNDISARIQALPPEKRAILEKLLEERSPGAEEASSRPVFEPPSTPTEQILAQAWEQVLGVSRVGLRDSFLALGGDSIQCVQVVARARQAGLNLTNRLLFERPVLSDLAAIVEPLPAYAEPQEPVVGKAPLTPIQRWFFELDLENRAHWNQSVLLEAPFEVEQPHWQTAFDALVAHHDALRLRFVEDEDGVRQVFSDVAPAAFERIDLTAVPSAEADDRLRAECVRLQRSLDLARGPLFRAALLCFGRGRADRLLLAAHHLTVDGLSFRILIEDLQRALDQLAAGRPIRLPLKTASFRKWAELRAAPLHQREVLERADFWRSIRPADPLPRDFDRGRNSEESAETMTIELDQTTTERLLREPTRRQEPLQALLLGALLEAFRPWSGDALLVELEGHGRDLALEGADVSRTVGWFTALYPVRLEAGDNLAGSVASVGRALAAVEGRGAEYGALRYLTAPGTLDKPLPVLTPEVLFNYLGRFGGLEAGTAFRLEDEAPAGLFDPQGRRAQILQFFGGVFSGRLRFHCIHSRNLHRPETIRALLERFERRLRELAGESGLSADPGFTAEDLRRIRGLAGGNR